MAWTIRSVSHKADIVCAIVCIYENEAYFHEEVEVVLRFGKSVLFSGSQHMIILLVPLSHRVNEVSAFTSSAERVFMFYQTRIQNKHMETMTTEKTCGTVFSIGWGWSIRPWRSTGLITPDEISALSLCNLAVTNRCYYKYKLHKVKKKNSNSVEQCLS